MPEQTVMTMREFHARLEELGKEDPTNWDKFMWTIDVNRNYRPIVNNSFSITASKALINNHGLIRVEISPTIN